MGTSYKRQYHERPKDIHNFEARLLAVIKRIVSSRDVLTLCSLFAWGRMTITIKSPDGDTVELWKPKRVDVVALFAHIYQHRTTIFAEYKPYAFVFEDATRRTVRNTELLADENDFLDIQQELDSHWGVHKRLLCPALRSPAALGRPVSPSLTQPSVSIPGEPNIMSVPSPRSSSGTSEGKSVGSQSHENFGWHTQHMTQSGSQARSLPTQYGQPIPQHYQPPQPTQEDCAQSVGHPYAAHPQQSHPQQYPRETYRSRVDHEKRCSNGYYPENPRIPKSRNRGVREANMHVQPWARKPSHCPKEEDNSSMVALVMAAMERIEAEKAESSADDSHSATSSIHNMYRGPSYPSRMDYENSNRHAISAEFTPPMSTAITPSSPMSSRSISPDHQVSGMAGVDNGNYTQTITLERKSSAETKVYYMRPGPLGKKIKHLVGGIERRVPSGMSSSSHSPVLSTTSSEEMKSAFGTAKTVHQSIGVGSSKTWRPW
eukprot:CFRG7572T1